MRLHLLLAKVEPKAMPVPSKCGYANCTSKQVQLHQPVKKALRDTVHQEVEAHRYRCLKYRRTFRVYPPGVTHAQSSERVKGLAVMLYLLGLSYGAVSLALGSLGVPLSKTRIFEILQEEGLRWRKQETWFGERLDPEFVQKRGPSKPSDGSLQPTASS